MTNLQQHWDRVYDTKAPTEVSWYQPSPDKSLDLIHAAAPDRASPILDIGCGTGALIAALVADGYGDLTGLDASAVAIGKAQASLGAAADGISWIVADITRWRPTRAWRVWHDRAVFHFLIEPQAQDAYIAAMSAALPAGATAIIATFALDGPQMCSGLSVQRYSAATLAAQLGQASASSRKRGSATSHRRTPSSASSIRCSGGGDRPHMKLCGSMSTWTRREPRGFGAASSQART